MSESPEPVVESLLPDHRSGFLAALYRNRGMELDHDAGAAVRTFLALVALAVVSLDPAPASGLRLFETGALAAYLLLSIAVFLMRWLSWQAHVLLRRAASTVDELMCLLVVIVFPDTPILYVPFVLFCMVGPGPSVKGSWIAIRCVVLAVGVALHDRLSSLTPAIQPADGSTLRLQIALIFFISALALARKLDDRRGAMTDDAEDILGTMPLAGRTLPLAEIGRGLACHFEVNDVVFAWQARGKHQAECLRLAGNQVEPIELPGEALNAMLAADGDHCCLLWDRASGKALVDRPGRSPVIVRRADDSLVPAAVTGDRSRVAALPISAGKVEGWLYLFPLPRISEATLDQSVRAMHALNKAIDRHALFEAWRGQAFANARFALSRDIHDSVLQTLAGLRLHIAALVQQNETISSAARRERLDAAEAVIVAEQAALRVFLMEGEQPASDAVDLIARLQQRLVLLSRQWEIPCRLSAEAGTLPVSAEMAIEVEFLVREAISNAVQHAGATELSVIVARREDWLFLTFKNDGKSAHRLSLVDIDENERIASRSLAQRLESIGGTAYADPMDGGVLLSMRIPMEGNENVATADR